MTKVRCLLYNDKIQTDTFEQDFQMGQKPLTEEFVMKLYNWLGLQFDFEDMVVEIEHPDSKEYTGVLTVSEGEVWYSYKYVVYVNEMCSIDDILTPTLVHFTNDCNGTGMGSNPFS